MTKIDLEPWEPEETIGKLWHAYASRLDAPRVYDAARVDLSSVGGRLAVFFRGLGGSPSVEIKATADEVSHHRLSLGRFMGTPTESTPRLPDAEATVEAAIRHLLGDPAPLTAKAARILNALQTGDFTAYAAPRRYRPYRPVAHWPDLRAPGTSHNTAVESRAATAPPEDRDSPEKTLRARRRAADQAERPDSFILHKFEALLSWAEFLNLNRRVDDDDQDDAKKAAQDAEEIALGQISKAPATRLKLHLDLAPEDVDREALSGVQTYPEWDLRTGTYLSNYVRVLTSDITPAASTPFRDDPRANARIRAVKRQFEALRPARIATTGHPDGDELDTDRAVRARVDFYATGQDDDRIWRQTRPQQRDLAVSILLDVSRSTESAIPGHGHGGRTVIVIEREALAALSWGLSACGDDFAIHAFSSLKRDRVYIQCAKRFGEPMSDIVEHRIAALQPGFYTRLGAAIRHASVGLAQQARKRRLLLVITDGKPNDLDHYEGRHGIEDSHKAVLEARRMGHAVFGITVDRDGKSWFPRMFGIGGFAVIPHPEKLTQALPQIYRQLVGA